MQANKGSTSPLTQLAESRPCNPGPLGYGSGIHRGVLCQGRPHKNASLLSTRRGHPASCYARRRDRERERTARSDNGGGESGGGPPGVDGGDSKAEGVDDRQSALKRIGMMPRQCGQTIVMRAAFAGSATADILGVATYDGRRQGVAAGPKNTYIT